MSDRAPLWRSPGLHFTVLGTVLYLLLQWLYPPPLPSVGPLAASQVEGLRRQWFATTGQAPTAAQLQGMVAAELDREILFREGLELDIHLHDPVVRQRLVRNMHFLRLGDGRPEEELYRAALRMELHTGDEVVRRRLVQVMEQLLLARHPPQAVTEADITAAFAERRQELRHPVRYSIEHVYLTRERAGEAQRVLAQLRGLDLSVGGASSSVGAAARLEANSDTNSNVRPRANSSMGSAVRPGASSRADSEADAFSAAGQSTNSETDASPASPSEQARRFSSPFLPGYLFRAQSPAQLARNFGAAFARNLQALEPTAGRWWGPVESTYGSHLVWLHEVEPARDARLEEVRGQLLRDLDLERRRLALRDAVARLRESYIVNDGISNSTDNARNNTRNNVGNNSSTGIDTGSTILDRDTGSGTNTGTDTDTDADQIRGAP